LARLFAIAPKDIGAKRSTGYRRIPASNRLEFFDEFRKSLKRGPIRDRELNEHLIVAERFFHTGRTAAYEWPKLSPAAAAREIPEG
jgi:hypothetical protein